MTPIPRTSKLSEYNTEKEGSGYEVTHGSSSLPWENKKSFYMLKGGGFEQHLYTLQPTISPLLIDSLSHKKHSVTLTYVQTGVIGELCLAQH